MTRRTSRRDFLRTSAGAAALAGGLDLLGPSPLAAEPLPLAGVAPRPPRARDTANVAVIGTGGMGGGHMNAFLKFRKDGVEDVRVVGLCDVCQPRLEAAKARCDTEQGGAVDT
jgi:ornithine cyclodeaminase/alanine dehydrogenase-like protein (mu-crystallin family)